MGRERIIDLLQEAETKCLDARLLAEDLIKELEAGEAQWEADGEENAGRIADLENEVEAKTRLIDEMARKYNHSFI